MGLDITHECWHGAYSAFMRWRCEIAKVAGLPPLQWMEGFYDWTDITRDEASAAVDAIGFEPEHTWARNIISAFYCGGNLPIKWDCLKSSPLHALLNHSDCDGEIQSDQCAVIASALELILPKLPEGNGGGYIGDWREKTKAFIDGLRLAAQRGENVRFY